MQKYLFFRPRGGFNDMMQQLEMMRRKALREDRIIVHDFSQSGLQAAFSSYFEVSDHFGPEMIEFNAEIGRQLNKFRSVAPPVFRWHVTNAGERVRGWRRLFTKKMWIHVPEVDRDSHHDERVVVVVQAGGGKEAIFALERLRFTQETAQILADRIKPLGDDYDAVHIRNSDYSTAYKPFLEEVRPAVAGRRLLLCTDSREVREFAQSLLTPKTEVLGMSDLPDQLGVALHTSKLSSDNRHKANLDLLTDLFAMARARRFAFPSLEAYRHLSHGKIEMHRLHHSVTVSGFAILTEALRQRPSALNRLFAKSDLPVPTYDVSHIPVDQIESFEKLKTDNEHVAHAISDIRDVVNGTPQIHEA